MRVENLIRIESSGASLNRESGRMPERSRHRSGERLCNYVTGKLGRRRQALSRSRENCSINNHRLTCERQEGDFSFISISCARNWAFFFSNNLGEKFSLNWGTLLIHFFAEESAAPVDLAGVNFFTKKDPNISAWV